MENYTKKSELISSAFLNRDELNHIQNLNATILLATYNVARSSNDNDNEKTRQESVSILTTNECETKSLKRQILPTEKLLSYHNCLVGKYCLSNKKGFAKQNFH